MASHTRPSEDRDEHPHLKDMKPPFYTPTYSDEELHQMLDYLIASGARWLVELHFEVWSRYDCEGGVQ